MAPNGALSRAPSASGLADCSRNVASAKDQKGAFWAALAAGKRAMARRVAFESPAMQSA